MLIVEFRGILFDHKHQLEDIFHPPNDGFDNHRAMSALHEMFTSSILVTRMIGCASMERTVTKIPHDIPLDDGESSPP